jgi:murein DD-endopeptidase MepM/ murein hydrolase activator NlpD
LSITRYILVGIGIFFVVVVLFWLVFYDNEKPIIPVRGVSKTELSSSWLAPRDNGRKHYGIDIFAKKGTDVVAMKSGIVIPWYRNSLGGKVVWILGKGFTLYYYAHLDSRNKAVTRPYRLVKQGEVVGYVGNTGNAVGTPPHLHFSIMRWGRCFDPYKTLIKAI